MSIKNIHNSISRIKEDLYKSAFTPMPPDQQQQGQPPAPAGGQVEDTQGTGGGTIGTGTVPTPQEEGFTGNQGPIQ